MHQYKFVLYILLLNFFLHSGVKSQPVFPGYKLYNFINNVVTRTSDHILADASFITNNPSMNTCWINIGYTDVAGKLLMTWDTYLFDKPGNDILIVCLNNGASGTAKARLQLSDNSYTNSQLVDFTTGMVNSTSGILTTSGYGSYTNTPGSNSLVPAVKPLDISSFYVGSLGIKGIEFTDFTFPQLDLITIAETKESTTPIKLKDFNCRYDNNTTILNWETLTEINSKRFEVQRSTDGISFSKIGEIMATGNSNNLNQYVYVDNNLTGFTHYYYRIKMIDIDNRFEYSQIREVSPHNYSFKILASQNSSTNTLYLSGGKSGATFSIINTSGYTVYHGLMYGSKTVISTANLANGLYLININSFDQPAIKILINNKSH